MSIVNGILWKFKACSSEINIVDSNLSTNNKVNEEMIKMATFNILGFNQEKIMIVQDEKQKNRDFFQIPIYIILHY